MLTISEVSKKLGIPFYRITYAELTRKIPPIPRIAGRRVFDEKLIAVIKQALQSEMKGEN